ncbi:MAG: hypothetical protein ABUS51_02040 [Acidobacteriota bacterium]
MSPSQKLNSRQPIVLLVPASAGLRGSFRPVQLSASRYETLLFDMQRLRGRIYLREGAIQTAQLTMDGRHELEVDESSWNVLLIRSEDRVVGCARYLEHENTVKFHELTAAQSALARSKEWGRLFQEAVEKEIARARQRQVRFVELGGWAIADELRGTTQALRIAMATYGLGRLLGGCIGITTATRRNQSASVLRRFGGASLTCGGVELPAYFDPVYNCEMEVLLFDTESSNPKFEQLLETRESEVAGVCAISRNPEHAAWSAGPARVA